MPMSNSLLAVLVVSLAYCLGCCNTGYYLVRWLVATDIRTLASGGTGSRNVGRLLGLKGFALTLLGDGGKGALAVWLALCAAADLPLALASLLAAVVGHVWPVQLGFRGGKGMAAFAGGMLVILPGTLLAGLAMSAVFYPIVRGSTKAGLLSLAFSPLPAVWELSRLGVSPLSRELGLYCLLVAIVLFAHRQNIGNALIKLKKRSFQKGRDL
jgi:acyl phosphate:glycerol-3-phosphate acyltransferase